MELIVNNNIIQEPIENIIYELKRTANWQVFKDIQNKGTWLRVTCPFHKDGNENRPSCSIFIDYNDSKVIPGTYHCFTCGSKGQLYQLVAFVLDISEEDAKQWLVDRYGALCYETSYNFGDWPSVENTKTNFLDESTLEQYKWYHPYMAQRHISMEIAKKFSVGWNQQKNTITFPVWDDKNNLLMITERAITNKNFFIPTGVEKPVYLLNFIKNEHITSAVVVEGQIDALVAWSYGIPAVALFGSGTTDYQIDLLNKSGIHNFILMYDNDEAGRKGAARFNKLINKNTFITNITMPFGKDVADCTKEEFLEILRKNNCLIS